VWVNSVSYSFLVWQQKQKMIDREGLPDFIIGGSAKCGTTSLHNILASRGDVFIPEGEVHFFSMGDFVQARGTVRYDPERTLFDLESDKKVEWYRSFFDPARDDQLIGEDSTVYLSSRVAPERIKKALPDVKLIFMLRNPVDRAYSHYWHQVNSGRATTRFEQELIHGPTHIHTRGFYKGQLERYLDLFPRDQIKVVLFERFIEETQSVVNEVCSYLGLQGTVDIDEVQSHSNASSCPQWLGVYLTLNYALKGLEGRIYRSHWPGEPSEELLSENDTGRRLLRNILYALRSRIPRKDSYPPMDESVRERLTQLYARENQGLGEMIDADLETYWPFT